MPGYKYKGDRPERDTPPTSEATPPTPPPPAGDPAPGDVWIPRAEAEKRITAAESTAHRARVEATRADTRYRAALQAVRADAQQMERDRATADAVARSYRRLSAHHARAATTNRDRVRRLLGTIRDQRGTITAARAEADRLRAELARSEERRMNAEGHALTADTSAPRAPRAAPPPAQTEVRVHALEGALADACKVIEELTSQRDREHARAVTLEARIRMIRAQTTIDTLGEQRT